MTAKPERPWARLMEWRLARRMVTVPSTIVLGVLLVVFAPLTYAVAALLDRGRPWQRVRLLTLITGTLIIEIVGLVAALLAWVFTGFGLLRKQRWTWHVYRPILGRYTATLFSLIVRVLGTSVEWRTEPLPDGPVVVLARHTSFFDAVIPATFVAGHNDLLPHHVVTTGLRYLPCIDIVGHRFPTRFIRRTPGEGSSELAKITELAQKMDHRSAAVIFPEGTFRSDERFERAVRRLRERDPELADQAERFDHVLPPRSNGSHALLAGAPGANVVICANTGLETFSTLAEIKASLVADRPIVVTTWNVKHADIPKDAGAFNEWLFAEYERIDDWVESETV